MSSLVAQPILFALALLSLMTASCTAEDPVRTDLLKTFVSEFVPITPGEGMFPRSFRMGSPEGPATEQPAHEVTIAQPFAMAKYEVPQNLYEAVMGANPSRWQGPRNSVEMMTWTEATEFCRKITTLLRQAKLIDVNEEIRLPTEAEWEYCCRAGTTTAYSFGDEARGTDDEGAQASLLSRYAWHTGNAAGNDPPVGALKPNPWGLYDMHGYLGEFTADAWHDSYQDAPTDGRAWTSDQPDPPRVIRGGSWKDRYDQLRSASRRKAPANARDDANGFRCVKTSAASGGR